MDKDELIQFGDRIKTLRFQLRKSQKDFAREVGISSSFLSEVEKGKTRPGYGFFKNIILKYNARPVFLFTGEGGMFLKSPGNQEEDPEKVLARAERLLREERELIEQMVWDIKHIPLVKFALLEFYSTYRFKNKAQIDQMAEEVLDKEGQQEE